MDVDKNVNKQYIGKFCFMEVHRAAFDSPGEYLIVEASPNCMYGIKPVADYGGHELRTFHMVGEKAATVLNSYQDNERAAALADGLEAFAEPKSDAKRDWVESVYAGARTNAAHIRRVLGDKPKAASREKRVVGVTIHYCDGTKSYNVTM